MSLIDTVMEIYHGVSKQKAKQILNHSEFIVDGRKIRKHPKFIVEVGLIIEIESIAKGSKKNALPTRNNPIAIHFEDEYFIVAVKPAGILAVNDKNQVTAKSFHKLLEDFASYRAGKKVRLWPVHRLDKEVEGLIIFAKDEEILEEMKENWQNVTKKYLALVENRPANNQGIIENWLREGHEQKAMVFNKEAEGSKFAKTEFAYLKEEGKFHLLEITLHTGRKNQIRAHLSHIGCPIVGDRKYGANDSLNRQVRLCAYKIEFKHPATGKVINLEYKPIARFFKPSLKEDENYKLV